MSRLFLLLVVSFFVSCAQAQPAAKDAPYKGLYVDGFPKILGNAALEDNLLKFAKKNGFTTLSLYHLHKLHDHMDFASPYGSKKLADFIRKAKTQYGIREVTAIGETYSFFVEIPHRYNKLHPAPEERFDAFNLEFEFWSPDLTKNGGAYCEDYLKPKKYPCTKAGAFDFYLSELKKIDSLAASDGIISETYLGWPDSLQVQAIASVVDRVLLHAYVNQAAKVYPYAEARLRYFAAVPNPPQLAMLYSAEKDFLKPWLKTHPETEVQSTFLTPFNTAPWKDRIRMVGYQWYVYSELLK